MALSPNLKVVQATDIRNVRRRPRRPQHKFNLRSKPYEIVPFMIAPVLPGETLQNLLMQSRVVTDPIKNRLIGWHKEYYFFYVPLPALKRDMDPDGLLQAMMLDPSTDISSLQAPLNAQSIYTFNQGMLYVSGCMNVVVREFFRDEDEELGDVEPLDNYWPAQIDQQQWFNSLVPAGGEDDLSLPGQEELEEMNVIPGFETQYAQWEIMRDAGLIDLDYDDFIRSYGVSVPKAEELEPDKDLIVRPELIRFSRSWSYPSNTIDPSDGSATSAVSWSIAERADKKRFFKYPGLIFGVTVTRPKVYLGNQAGAAVGLLKDAYSWLPAVLTGHHYVSVQELETQLYIPADPEATPEPIPGQDGQGIIQNVDGEFWIDVKDLFLYGDQFINYTPDVAETHAIALPEADTAAHKYPDAGMVDALFVGGAAGYVREDGVVHMNVLGKLAETTPA